MSAVKADTLFFQWIRTIPAITDIVGNRIYPAYGMQDETGCSILYELVDSNRPEIMLGTQTNHRYRSSTASLKLTCLSESKNELDSLAVAFEDNVHSKGSGDIRLAKMGTPGVNGDIEGLNSELTFDLIIRAESS